MALGVNPSTARSVGRKRTVSVTRAQSEGGCPGRMPTLHTPDTASMSGKRVGPHLCLTSQEFMTLTLLVRNGELFIFLT